MARTDQTGSLFQSIYGRNLIAELPNIAHRPYCIVTMADLWKKFSRYFEGDRNCAGTYFVHTIDGYELEDELAKLPPCASIIGIGGGQAVDTAKYFSWLKRLPLFTVPTSMSVNAAFGHRSGLRFDGKVRYIGFVVPEAVYIDYDVIRSAPAILNRSGICEILCYHTAHYDWKLAHDHGKCEAKWPYDQRLVDEANGVMTEVMRHLDEIREVNETGIRVLMEANRWGGAAFHNAGWNPRHIEGADHFLFYALEYCTGKKFIHGQPVCLGIYAGSVLQDNKPEDILAMIHRAGVDIRPESMGITWDDVFTALRTMRWYVDYAGLWYGVYHEREFTESQMQHIRKRVVETFG